MKQFILFFLLSLYSTAAMAEKEISVLDMQFELLNTPTNGYTITKFIRRGSLGFSSSYDTILSTSEVNCVRLQKAELDKAGLEQYEPVLLSLQTNRHSTILEGVAFRGTRTSLALKLSVQHSLSGKCGLLLADQIQRQVAKIAGPIPNSVGTLEDKIRREFGSEKISYSLELKDHRGYNLEKEYPLDKKQISCVYHTKRAAAKSTPLPQLENI
jgi:hypothetical protein